MKGVFKKTKKRVVLVLIVLALLMAGLSAAQASETVNIPDANLEMRYIRNNYLDISQGSETMDLIQGLIDNGVYAEYIPQRGPEGLGKLTVKVVGQGTANPQVGLAWEPFQDAGSYKIYRKEILAPAGCFVATAAYGSSLSPSVVMLRQFRDTYLLNSKVGPSLVGQYYKHSPSWAGAISQSSLLKGLARLTLLPFICLASLAVNWPLALTGLIITLLWQQSIRKRRRPARDITACLLTLMMLWAVAAPAPGTAQGQADPTEGYKDIAEVNDTSYTDQDVTPGGTYKYIVAAVSPEGQEIAYSNPESVEIAFCRCVEDAGPVEILYVDWVCATASTYVVKAVLEDMGYQVTATPVSASRTWEGLAAGDADFMTTAWLPVTHGHYLEETGDRLVEVSTSFEGALLGWVVPVYVEMDSIEDINDNLDKLGGRVVGIDPGAGLMSLSEKVITEYGLDVELLEGSDAEMTAALKDAVEREEWIVVTGWAPHWKFAYWPLKILDDPKGVLGGGEYIATIARQGLKEDMPEVYHVLENFAWTAADIGEVMEMNMLGGTPESNARAWVANNPDKVQQWTP